MKSPWLSSQLLELSRVLSQIEMWILHPCLSSLLLGLSAMSCKSKSSISSPLLSRCAIPDQNMDPMSLYQQQASGTVSNILPGEMLDLEYLAYQSAVESVMNGTSVECLELECLAQPTVESSNTILPSEIIDLKTSARSPDFEVESNANPVGIIDAELRSHESAVVSVSKKRKASTDAPDDDEVIFLKSQKIATSTGFQLLSQQIGNLGNENLNPRKQLSHARRVNDVFANIILDNARIQAAYRVEHNSMRKSHVRLIKESLSADEIEEFKRKESLKGFRPRFLDAVGSDYPHIDGDGKEDEPDIYD
jgi:hypothetical protein